MYSLGRDVETACLWPEALSLPPLHTTRGGFFSFFCKRILVPAGRRLGQILQEGCRKVPRKAARKVVGRKKKKTRTPCGNFRRPKEEKPGREAWSNPSRLRLCRTLPGVRAACRSTAGQFGWRRRDSLSTPGGVIGATVAYSQWRIFFSLAHAS